ncbi:MbtH family protein [Nonomuraea sp. NPDC050556]|uniref:MbtH family protein n=1 Tax=Nonomuraea sp. NPDC050556 TaxID=3364369 RepID=UPI003793253F
MISPFENKDSAYFVLLNGEGQYSLWPDFINIPSGWSVVHGLDTRANCLAYIEDNWTDMRPTSLVE